MNRTQIHEQIATLAEKIMFLNEKISQEAKLHPVEMDLLLGYTQEMHGMAEALVKLKSDLKVISRRGITPEATPVIAEEKTPKEEQPVADTEPNLASLPASALKELEMTLEDPEAAVQAPQPPAVAKEEVISQVKTEEIVIKKTTLIEPAPAKEGNARSLNERLKRESTPLADRLKDARKKNMKELFDLNERYLFIGKLFGGNAEQFKKAMNDLGKCTREEAETYIKNIESKYAWQTQEALSVRFTSSVLEFLS